MVVINQELSFPAPTLETSALNRGYASILRDHSSVQWISRHPVPYAVVKRAMDVALSLFFRGVLAPLYAVLAALIKLSSPGPAIFKQVRVGERGRLFAFYKFRSMYMDAEARKSELLHLSEVTGPVFKMKNDPRITPLGRILRKYSLDELPQFYNVLRGDLSIVGPRPPVPDEVAQYTPRQLLRLSVRPGLTCIWQVSGRSAVGFDEWVEMDLRYLETMSVRTDIAIFFKTIPAVLTGRGAH